MFRVKSLYKFPNVRFLSAKSERAIEVHYSPPHQSDLHRALLDAEKVAQCSTSLINLRWITDQNMMKFIVLLKQLSMENINGTQNTVLHTLAKLIQSNKTDLQFFGLIVVLVSKAAGYMMAQKPHPNKIDAITGILKSQHSIAEIVETFRVKNILHDEMKNLQTLHEFGNKLPVESDVVFGNKIALLSGDFLSANIILKFANLSDPQTIEMGASLVRDYSESKFFGERDEHNFPLPSNPVQKREHGGLFNVDLDEIELTKNFDPKLIHGHPEREWTYRTALSLGSTLGYCCRGAMAVAKMPKAIQDHAYKFGRNFAITLQAYAELEPFRCWNNENEDVSSMFSLVGAPALFHLSHDPTVYDEIIKGTVSIVDVNYTKLHREIMKGPGIEKTKSMIRYHGEKATEALKVFNDSEAKEALQNLIFAMESSCDIVKLK